MTATKPATSLPWLIDTDGDLQTRIGDKLADMHITRQEDAAYIVHAANAYPELIKVVKHFASMPDILSVAEHEQLTALLAKLGEG
jgi:hypothetical protein